MPPLPTNVTEFVTKALPFSTVIGAAATAKVLNANRDRVAIVLSSDATNAFTLGRNDVTAANGLRVPPNTAPTRYSQTDVGDLVTHELWAQSTLGATVQGFEIVKQGP